MSKAVCNTEIDFRRDKQALMFQPSSSVQQVEHRFSPIVGVPDVKLSEDATDAKESGGTKVSTNWRAARSSACLNSVDLTDNKIDYSAADENQKCSFKYLKILVGERGFQTSDPLSRSRSFGLEVIGLAALINRLQMRVAPIAPTSG
jgi:hypothetical protein